MFIKRATITMATMPPTNSAISCRVPQFIPTLYHRRAKSSLSSSRNPCQQNRDRTVTAQKLAAPGAMNSPKVKKITIMAKPGNQPECMAAAD